MNEHSLKRQLDNHQFTMPLNVTVKDLMAIDEVYSIQQNAPYERV